MGLTAENIGGITATDVDLSPGVTVLAGRNATNRTSLLYALMAALGSDVTPLKADADEGRVALNLHGETYTREFTRENGQITRAGEPYLDDPTVADLFAFLLEENQARQAVEQGDDLREVIMRPVDTDEIQAEIDRLTEKKRAIQSELDDLDALEEERTELTQRQAELGSTIEETQTALSEKTEEIDEIDANVADVREEKAELEAALTELQDRRSQLEDVRFDLKTERDSLESLEADRERVANELESLPERPAGEVDDVDRRLQRLRGRKETLDETITELQSVIQFNEETLEGDSTDLLDAVVGDDTETSAPTDKLLDDKKMVTCWTCGSEVEKDAIESTLERLRTLRKEKFEQRNEIDSEISELQSQRREFEEQRENRQRLERERDRIATEIEDRTERVTELEEQKSQLRAEIDELEADIESGRDEEYGAILELHKEANQLEFELEQYQDERSEVHERLEEIDARLDDRDALTDRRAEINDQLTELRTRVEQIEKQAVEAFNTHIGNLLEILAYDNIERIWIERTETTVREGRRTVPKTIFDLHVVRSTAEGTTYEDSVEHLSESEREVTGLVFALAGYLIHDVHEEVPFLLLDSLEAIDSNRIASLVGYFDEFVENLVVALLLEDAAALPEKYQSVEKMGALPE
jgi:DNA repair exonuclease SbcCD ATPase subunit